MRGYRYTNLTSALRDRDSPLRRYLDERFPKVRVLQADYRAKCGPLLVDGGSADPATLGAAFDLEVRFRLDPAEPPTIAALGFADRPERVRTVVEVMRTGRDAVGRGDGDLLARACWALALCTEVYRVGVRRASPLWGLLERDRFTASALLALAPADAVRQLAELRDVAAGRLLPHLSAPYALGPTFDGSRLCAADADLIADGLLLDLKTRLGAKNPRTGRRSDGLPRLDVYQLLGYTFFDHSDDYRIDAIGIYSARYGALVTWPLQHALDVLAGEPVDVRAARERVWELLGE
ncbi:hypothetical protein [Nocardioides sp. GXZ039]|uniref:hypothetical protein n=1 Tax=Nocardioides sp. GXZ039 TaxID=3136018 RepID=UPI0030F44E78